jgi:hypothetical protein
MVGEREKKVVVMRELCRAIIYSTKIGIILSTWHLLVHQVHR